MAHLVFRCDKNGRVIVTGIELHPDTFNSLHKARIMRCKFCGQDHVWEVVKRIPAAAVLMSIKAEDCLGRSVQNDMLAARATNLHIRALHEQLSGQWFDLAIEHEAKANALA